MRFKTDPLLKLKTLLLIEWELLGELHRREFRKYRADLQARDRAVKRLLASRPAYRRICASRAGHLGEGAKLLSGDYYGRVVGSFEGEASRLA